MTMPDPGSLDAAAVAMHEMFMSYIRAGFNKREALELVKVHLAELIRKVDGPEEEEGR